MTKKCLVTILTALAGTLAMAHPDGFVYRGRISRLNPVREVGQVETIGFTASLYRDLGASTPLWTGYTNITVSADGRYQVWISDAMRLKEGGGSETLVDALTKGHATALGITLGNDTDEQKPRISLSTMPMVRFARNTSNIDDGGVVTGRTVTDYLVAQDRFRLGRSLVATGITTTAMGDLPLRVDSWETTGTGGTVLTRSQNENRRIFSDAEVQHKDLSYIPTNGVTVLVGPGNDAIFTSSRGGVVSISCGRMLPCASFFVNPGETFKMPFDVPADTHNTKGGRPCNVRLNFLEYGE